MGQKAHTDENCSRSYAPNNQILIFRKSLSIILFYEKTSLTLPCFSVKTQHLKTQTKAVSRCRSPDQTGKPPVAHVVAANRFFSYILIIEYNCRHVKHSFLLHMTTFEPDSAVRSYWSIL